MGFKKQRFYPLLSARVTLLVLYASRVEYRRARWIKPRPPSVVILRGVARSHHDRPMTKEGYADGHGVRAYSFDHTSSSSLCTVQCCFPCNKYLSRLLYRTASPTSATRLPEDSSGAWLESRIPNDTCACQLVRADVRHLQNGLFVPTHPKHPIPSDCIHCTDSK